MAKLISLSLAVLVGGAAAFSVSSDAAAPHQWVAGKKNLVPWSGSAQAPAIAYRHSAIERGDILSTVTATGTLRPTATVVVGSQIAGQIKEIYADFNTTVGAGDPLALINPVSFTLSLAQADTDLEIARIAIEAQKTVIRKAELSLASVRHDLRAAQAGTDAARARAREVAAEARRNEHRLNGDAERTRSELEAVLATLRGLEEAEGSRQAQIEIAEAEVEAARTQLEHAEAMLRQRETALRQAQIDLANTQIASPVDGVVMIRHVEVGETVDQMLFTLAHDLRELELQASVDESEIGRLEPGQRVEFTVDAFRHQRFAGIVDHIRKAPTVSQNVVTYTVVVKAANPDLLLLPGMTASVRFVLAEARDVAIAPNAALRFRPEGLEAPAGPHVWVEEPGGLRSIPVALGLTDEARTEIRGEGVAPGLRVVTGAERPRPEASAARRLLGGL
jgi:HlyD family secretion protein